MKVPSECSFTKDHEWAKKEGSAYVVGISDYAQDQLGDVVFLELPSVGKIYAKGDSMAVVESVKAASDIYAPISGKIVEINQKAVDSPDLINSDPFLAAWLVKIEPSKPEELGELLDASSYEKYVAELVG